jgi:predicted lipoprotein with Yx(FWY)xxD motif
MLLVAGLVAIMVVGCGASTSGTTGNGIGATGGSSATVSTASATVSGKSETILTDNQGKTLYYFDDDTATASACTTGCNTTWPPLTVSSGTPTSSDTLSGTLSAKDVGNGLQALYNGHPLYRYSGDTASGQTNGDGFEGKWHVATPNVAMNTGSSGGTGAQPTPTPCSGPYCY